MSLLKNWRFWLGLAISAVCLWLALRSVPLAELPRLMAGMNLVWLAPIVLLQLLAVITRAKRWVIVLGKEERLAESFWAQGIGYLFTNLFPLRMGEPARVIVMSERCRLPIVQVAASALVERLLDVATIVLVLVLLLPWMQIPVLVARAGMTFGTLILLACVMLVLAVRFSHRVESLLRAVCGRFPILPEAALVARWQELVNGLAPLMRWTTALRVIAWSILTWACSIAVYWCVLRSFQADSTWLEAAFMVAALSLALTVPSSPGFIGVFQLVGQQALVLPFGGKYDAATALAITLTAHIVYYLITTAMGIVGLWRLGESFAGLWQAIRPGSRSRLETGTSS
jgi:uncharacterized protein (TIRG00374 family)